jgi:hypothetical protein
VIKLLPPKLSKLVFGAEQKFCSLGNERKGFVGTQRSLREIGLMGDIFQFFTSLFAYSCFTSSLCSL